MASEIEQIQQVMRTDRNAYFRDTAMQSRYQELLATQIPMPLRWVVMTARSCFL